ncbi:MAG: pilin [Patescibacteria group bacterium]|nr:pilin [Patescibacteria group bacterium]
MRNSKFKIIFFVLSAVILLQTQFVLATGTICTERSNNFANGGCPAGEKCYCCSGTTESGACTEKTPGICGVDGKPQNVICPFSTHTDVESFIKDLINWIFWFAIILCPLIVIIAGFLYLISRGDSGKTNLAKKLIQWAIIGLAVILASRGVYGFIQYILVGG